MLVSMLCALIFLNAYPQNKVDKEVNLSPVVVTGTGTHHRQTDSPVPVQVITQQDAQYQCVFFRRSLAKTQSLFHSVY